MNQVPTSIGATLQCITSGHPELTFEVDCSFGSQNNALLYQALLDGLAKYGIHCYLGHVVVSGHNFWVPTRTQMLTKAETTVTRQVRDVYVYIPGQTLIFTYGEATESAKVAKIGEVSVDELSKLVTLGDLVWQATVVEASAKPLFMTVLRTA